MQFWPRQVEVLPKILISEDLCILQASFIVYLTIASQISWEGSLSQPQPIVPNPRPLAIHPQTAPGIVHRILLRWEARSWYFRCLYLVPWFYSVAFTSRLYLWSTWCWDGHNFCRAIIWAFGNLWGLLMRVSHHNCQSKVGRSVLNVDPFSCSSR